MASAVVVGAWLVGLGCFAIFSRVEIGGAVAFAVLAIVIRVWIEAWLRGSRTALVAAPYLGLVALGYVDLAAGRGELLWLPFMLGIVLVPAVTIWALIDLRRPMNLHGWRASRYAPSAS